MQPNLTNDPPPLSLRSAGVPRPLGVQRRRCEQQLHVHQQPKPPGCEQGLLPRQHQAREGRRHRGNRHGDLRRRFLNHIPQALQGGQEPPDGPREDLHPSHLRLGCSHEVPRRYRHRGWRQALLRARQGRRYWWVDALRVFRAARPAGRGQARGCHLRPLPLPSRRSGGW